MKDGICPKCQAKEVHIYANTPAEISINLGFLRHAGLVYHICTNCGYVELYVENKYDLPKIAEKYRKV